jgi:DNA-binding NtrC family response regulator
LTLILRGVRKYVVCFSLKEIKTLQSGKFLGNLVFMEMVHFIPSSQRRLALLAAQADSAPVLIYGASGTGKSAIASWIHSSGPRAAGLLKTAHHNTSLSEQIIAAHGGTLVVPEMGELNLSEQLILLQLLKTKTVPHPANPNTPALVNVRIIGTTSQALEGRAQGGLFNRELLNKLNVFRIEMPPLSKRAEEFEDIVIGIVGEITRELHKEHLRTLSPEAWKQLKMYDWPGNLREIRNVLRVAVIAAQGSQIETQDLPDFDHTRIDFRATREQFEKIYLLELLETFNWEIDKTCSMTQIDKSALLSKIKHYGINLIH